MITIKNVGLCVVTFLLITALNYFIFLKQTINAYFTAKNQWHALSQTLSQEEAQQKEDSIIQQSLLSFKAKIDVYQAATTIHTPNQLSAQLTPTIEQSGFSIHSIQPISLNKSVHFQVNAEGDYFALFRLFDALNNTAWPIYLEGIVIEKKNQFHLDFSTQGLV